MSAKKRRFFKRHGDKPIGEPWLFVNSRGDYEYRNPDSVYVHAWNTFPTEAEARDWLDRCVAKVQQPDWTLYVAAPVSLIPEEGK